MAKCNRKQRLLGKSIRRIRMRRNMTQRELANAAGLGESALRSYELGERSPKQNTLERIAETLDVAPACFDTYGIERYDELVHALFLLEDRFGIEPCADGSIRFTDEAIQSCVCTWRDWKEFLEKGKSQERNMKTRKTVSLDRGRTEWENEKRLFALKPENSSIAWRMQPTLSVYRAVSYLAR